jgi:hypothetical protein
MSIPCHARLIVNDGILRTNNTVKQRGLADVRAAYDRDDVAGHSIDLDYKIAELTDVLSTYKDFSGYKVAKNEVSFNEAQ